MGFGRWPEFGFQDDDGGGGDLDDGGGPVVVMVVWLIEVIVLTFRVNISFVRKVVPPK